MTGILNILAGSISSAIKDGYFNLVTLLLPGNGTNGAQNNTFLDSSSNNFTITRNGGNPGMTQGTFSPFSQTGWSINNTTNEHGIKTSSSVAIGTSVFTMEFWIYFTNTPSTGTIGFCADGTNNSGIFYGDLTSLGFGQANVGLNLSGTPGFTLNAWFHVAVARDSSNRMSIWVNGSRIATATGITANYATAPMAMGGSGFRYQGYCSNGRLVVGTAVYDPTATTITVPTSPLTAITNTSVLLGTSNRFNDASANNYGITVTGTPSVQAFSPFAPTAAYSASTIGGSGYFDGSGDYLTTNNINLGTNAFTIEGWFYVTTTAGNMNYWGMTNGGGTNPKCLLYMDNAGNITFETGSVSGAVVSASISTYIRRNAWQHIAISRSGTGANQTAMFIDGVRAATGTCASLATVTAGFNVGYIGEAFGVTLNGYVSGFRIVNGTAVYNPASTTVTIPTAPLTAITNTALLTNFTNAGITDATAKNDLETVGNAQISTTQSKFGGSSMYFDGNGDYLIAPNSKLYAFQSANFTVEMWVYPSTVSAVQYLFDTRDPASTTSAGIQWYINASAKLGVYVGTTAVITASTTSLSANTWTHLALVKNGSTWTLYINGTADATTGTNSTALTQEFLTIACSCNQRAATTTDKYSGYIDDLRITNGYARYTSNFTAPTAAFALQ